MVKALKPPPKDSQLSPSDIEVLMNYAEVFSTPAGQRVLAHLKSLTLLNVSGPHNLNANALMHLEGQRYLVGLIQSNIDHGHKVRSNG